MATPIRIKRSAVAGKKPTDGQLQLGELAVNFYDGKIFLKQDTGGVGVGTRIVEVGAGSTTFAGKTLFVTENGNDDNTGLDENNAKATIKSAVALTSPGDTIKVFPGTYTEDNPINLPDNVSVEGTELRRCLVAPQNVGSDLFYVSQGCHVTDLSFVGGPMTGGSSVISLRPLVGVSSDRFFDAARLIRGNLDFISKEAVGYITNTDYKHTTHTITDAQYSPITGILTATISNHGFSTGDSIQFNDGSITFSCSYGSGGNEAYPRASDYASNRDLTTTSFPGNKFAVSLAGIAKFLTISVSVPLLR